MTGRSLISYLLVRNAVTKALIWKFASHDTAQNCRTPLRDGEHALPEQHKTNAQGVIESDAR